MYLVSQIQEMSLKLGANFRKIIEYKHLHRLHNYNYICADKLYVKGQYDWQHFFEFIIQLLCNTHNYTLRQYVLEISAERLASINIKHLFPSFSCYQFTDNTIIEYTESRRWRLAWKSFEWSLLRIKLSKKYNIIFSF